MAKPKMIGSIGCFIESRAKFGRKEFSFNGTTLDLVKCALRAGATVGSKIKADFGGGFRTGTLCAAPHDPRANGVWISGI